MSVAAVAEPPVEPGSTDATPPAAAEPLPEAAGPTGADHEPLLEALPAIPDDGTVGPPTAGPPPPETPASPVDAS